MLVVIPSPEYRSFQAIMTQLSGLTKLVSSYDKKIEDLTNTVAAQSLTIANCLNDISALRSENELLRKKIANIEDNVSNSSGLTHEEIFAESVERIKRKNNVLLMGVHEISPEEDSANVKNILSAISPHSLSCISSMTRLGRKINENKPRPYRITFQNPEAALDVLKKNHNLPRSDYPSLKVVSDMTPNEIEHLNKLREELRLRLRTENNLTIKYINGVPKIVNVANGRDGSKRGRVEEISPRRDPGLKIPKTSSSRVS